MSSLFKSQFILSSLFLGTVAWCQEENSDQTSYIEQTRAIVSQNVISLSDSIDSLFGNTQYEDRYNSSTLHVSQSVQMKNGVPGVDNLEASLNLDLPNLKNMESRLREYLFSSNELSKSDGAIVEDDAEVSSWDFNQESGVIVTFPLDYFLRLRARREFLAGKFVHSFYEQVGWSKKREWEAKTSLTSDSALNRYLLFRFMNDFNWAMTNNTLGLQQGPSLIYQISDTQGISFDFRHETAIEANAFLTDRLTLAALYRQETPLQWVFLSLSPELAWERQSQFRPLYNFYLTFEFVFAKRGQEKG